MYTHCYILYVIPEYTMKDAFLLSEMRFIYLYFARLIYSEILSILFMLLCIIIHKHVIIAAGYTKLITCLWKNVHVYRYTHCVSIYHPALNFHFGLELQTWWSSQLEKKAYLRSKKKCNHHFPRFFAQFFIHDEESLKKICTKIRNQKRIQITQTHHFDEL